MEGKFERVLRFVLGHEDFRFIGSSRTDSGVHCRRGFVQIFLGEKVDFEPLLTALNQNLSGDITVNAIKEVPRSFNLISSVTQKTYRYFFADQLGFHPFASAMVTPVSRFHDLEKMQENASLFVGKHDFKAFCKASPNKADFVREVLEAKIFPTDQFLGGFFPDKVYCLEVTGSGFLHHQIRKMISAIWTFDAQEIRERLDEPDGNWQPVPTAPAQGLVLWETLLDLKLEV